MNITSNLKRKIKTLAIVFCLNTIHVAAKSATRGTDGGGGGGGISRGLDDLTFGSAKVKIDKCLTQEESLTEIPGLSIYNKAIDNLFLPVIYKNKLRQSANPDDRCYLKIEEAALPPEKRAAFIAEYTKVIGATGPFEEKKVFAYTDSEHNTYLLPGFFGLKPNEQSAILFHETEWDLDSGLTYRFVMESEVDFQNYVDSGYGSGANTKLMEKLEELFQNSNLNFYASVMEYMASTGKQVSLIEILGKDLTQRYLTEVQSEVIPFIYSYLYEKLQQPDIGPMKSIFKAILRLNQRFFVKTSPAGNECGDFRDKSSRLQFNNIGEMYFYSCDSMPGRVFRSEYFRSKSRFITRKSDISYNMIKQAVIQNNLPLVKSYIDAGKALDLLILREAVLSGGSDILEYMLSRGANVNEQLVSGETVLMSAIEELRTEYEKNQEAGDKLFSKIAILLKYKPDIRIRDHLGRDALFYLAKSRSPNLLREFIKNFPKGLNSNTLYDLFSSGIVKPNGPDKIFTIYSVAKFYAFEELLQELEALGFTRLTNNGEVTFRVLIKEQNWGNVTKDISDRAYKRKQEFIEQHVQFCKKLGFKRQEVKGADLSYHTQRDPRLDMYFNTISGEPSVVCYE